MPNSHSAGKLHPWFILSQTDQRQRTLSLACVLTDSSLPKVSIRILPVWGDYKRSEGPWVRTHTIQSRCLQKRIAPRSCGPLAASGGLRAHPARSPERTCPVLASEKAGLPRGTASPGGERRVEEGWGGRSRRCGLTCRPTGRGGERGGS